MLLEDSKSVAWVEVAMTDPVGDGWGDGEA